MKRQLSDGTTLINHGDGKFEWLCGDVGCATSLKIAVEGWTEEALCAVVEMSKEKKPAKRKKVKRICPKCKDEIPTGTLICVNCVEETEAKDAK